MNINNIKSLGEAEEYIYKLKSRTSKDNAIRFFIDKFGFYC